MKDAHPKFVVLSSFDCTNRPLIVPLLLLTSIGLDRNWLCMGAHEPYLLNNLTSMVAFSKRL